MSTPTTLSLKKIYSGKVRDLYEIEDKRMPVSYTHLDVYKRQTSINVWSTAGRRC